MLSFKDFLAANITTDETGQQDLTAMKRQCGLVDEEEEKVDEHIVKVSGGYRLVSKKSGKNLGTYPTKAGAEKRERQVQYFKHNK